MHSDRRAIDPVAFKRRREEFTAREIPVLVAHICFTVVAQMFGAITRLPADDATRR